MYLTLKQLVGKQVSIQTIAKYAIRGTITQLYKDGKQWVVKVQEHDGASCPTGKLTSRWISTRSIAAVEEMLHPESYYIVKLDEQGNPIPYKPAETQVQPELPKVEEPKPKEPVLPIPLPQQSFCYTCGWYYCDPHTHINHTRRLTYPTTLTPTITFTPATTNATPYVNWAVTNNLNS